MRQLLHTVSAISLLLLNAAALASDLPNEIESVSYATHRDGIASFGGDGYCAIKIRGDWVQFSRDRDANIHQELGSDARLVLNDFKSAEGLRGVTINVALRDPEDRSRSKLVTLAPSLRREGVPIYLADFVSRACVMESSTDKANLARVRELPVNARRHILQLMSIAALRRYHVDTSPTSSDTPSVYIPYWASRCAVGIYCDRWVASVSRGFDGKWTP